MEAPTEAGRAVFVNGAMVAWFAEFNEAAEDWCIDNYYGEWLTYPAASGPVVVLDDCQVVVGVDELRKVTS